MTQTFQRFCLMGETWPAWSVHSVVYLVPWKTCATTSLWWFGFEYMHGRLDGWKIKLTNLKCTVLHPHCVLRGAFVSHSQLDAQAVHSVALNRKCYSGYICCMSIGLSGEYGVETSASMLSARALHTCSIGNRWWAHCHPRVSGIKIKMPWSASSHGHVTFTI